MKQEKKNALIKAILFVVRVKRAAEAAPSKTSESSIPTDPPTAESPRDSDDTDDVSSSAASVNHEISKIRASLTSLPHSPRASPMVRCRTVGSQLSKIQGGKSLHRLRAPSMPYNGSDDDESGGTSVGTRASHRSRTRSSSWICRSTSVYASNMRDRTDTCPARMGRSRFVDYTAMSKPYTVTFSNAENTKEKSNYKSINIIHNSMFAEKSQAIASKIGSRIVRRMSGKDYSTGGGATSGSDQEQAPPTNANSACDTLRRKQQAQLRRRKTETEQHFASHLKCTSEENVGASTSDDLLVQKKSYSNYVLKRKSSTDLLDIGCSGNAPTLAPSTAVAPVIMPSAKIGKKKSEKSAKLTGGSFKSSQELFTAVEQDDIGKVRKMLAHGEADIHGENRDELTLLEVAILLSHNEVAHLLLKHGAQENPRFSSTSARSRHLQQLIENAQLRLAELTVASKKVNPTVKDIDSQLSVWESRLHMLRKMKVNFDGISLPSAARNIALYVSSATSLLVQFEPPDQSRSLVTKYKIEWSSGPDFSQPDGCLLIKDLRRLETTIPNLRTGDQYYVRVIAGNFKGFGASSLSLPEFAVPSSWREVDDRPNRSASKLATLNTLYHEVKEAQRVDKWDRRAPPTSDSPQKKKRPSFKNLFLGNAKFQKNLKKGVYLACIFYKDDKLLCTVDDCLPIVEVEENAPPSLISDFNWFVKASCAWEELKSFALECDIAHASPMLQFRMKLLEAALHMQTVVGVQNLGRFYYRPLIDRNGVTIFLTVENVFDLKAVQGLAVKWIPMTKFLKKHAAQEGVTAELTATEMLAASLFDFLNFHESATVPLDRGLYLGYVKMHSSMNQISVVVPENLPSVLPFVYIRENPHVSKEEWDWLKILDANEAANTRPSATQLAFHWALRSAAKILLEDLEIGEEDITTHRVYRLEVIEVHPEVSFILLVPCHGEVCSAPGQLTLNGGIETAFVDTSSGSTPSVDRSGCLPIPVQTFELIHLCTYQPEFITLYCRLSSLVEMHLLVAQQILRQAFAEDEVRSSREFVDSLVSFQTRLDDVWRTVRWIADIATRARDKHIRSGLPLSVLFAYSPSDFPASRSIVEEADGEVGPLVVVAAPPEAGASDEAREGEDSSDVGYHSDQSIDKMGLAAAAANDVQMPAPSPSPEAIPQGAVDNPIYGYLPPIGTAPHEKLKRLCSSSSGQSSPSLSIGRPAPPSRNSYVNLPPPIADLSYAGRFRGTSFLHHGVAGSTRKYHPQVSSITAKSPEPGTLYSSAVSVASSSSASLPASMYTATTNLPGLTHRSHEYVNYQSDCSETMQSEGRLAASRVSDSELSSNALVELKRRLAHEDLSIIDRVYEQNFQTVNSFALPTVGATKSVSANNLQLRATAGSVLSGSLSPQRPTSSASCAASPASGILRVYAAYETGLARGTSVKLHITPKTTSREVVTLVVQQLNKSAQMKGVPNPPVYGDAAIGEFCLVAVIGSRERCLRDDFKPLDLQNPWSKGRLFVRLRSDVLAALEFGNAAVV